MLSSHTEIHTRANLRFLQDVAPQPAAHIVDDINAHTRASVTHEIKITRILLVT